ncbi:MAG: SDR family oxidoreductase [Rhodospirillaceae bacterium]|jgi:3-oxoacyl-[acyl-carrier protein] reductase|nr:SDR family oxidoreductase [Rhodospirillaceae bacterium]MBT5241102.1 SDR family oxidoreductase [Rhodospirillaceae bacterium]MBT5566758.1 SDR family oxidoreductase [Rhodospirillaceae bacterium]MBT6090820.1 SDR family oxidoreductase [Rhodospirillaceae bacterium]MBT6962393.1 SDR family oxidoreductase [Rhodospirillaceae bacterium]
MDLLLKDKVALITGASRGLGAASAAALAAEGTNLVLSARDGDALDSQVKRLTANFGIRAIAVPADLTQNGVSDSVVKSSLDAFGRIDILINSAGASQGGLFWEIPDQVWQDSMELKVMGTIRMMRAVIPHMLENKGGRIVNIVGNTGLQPSPRLLPGSAANAALLAVTRGLAEELAPQNVIINALNPGPTRTERWTTLMAKLAESSGRSVADVESDYTAQIPMDRLGEPEEIGRLAAFLASERAANMTGGCLTADGGWTKGIG